jgi:hypothetical protein
MKQAATKLATKLIYVIAALLSFAAASGTGSQTRTHRSRIEMVYQPQANGDYRLYLFGSDRTLVCEEKEIKVVEQGDAVSPVVLECRH